MDEPHHDDSSIESIEFKLLPFRQCYKTATPTRSPYLMKYNLKIEKSGWDVNKCRVIVLYNIVPDFFVVIIIFSYFFFSLIFQNSCFF